MTDKNVKRGRPMSELGAYQREQAKQLQVSLRTVQRWEKNRQEIKADPELAALATSVEGNQEAKRLLRQRKKAEEAPYNAVKSLFSAIKAWEALGDEDARLVREYLLETDVLDRISSLFKPD